MRLHTQTDKPSGIGFRCQRNPLPKLTAGHSPRQVPSNPQISAGLSSLLSPHCHSRAARSRRARPPPLLSRSRSRWCASGQKALKPIREVQAAFSLSEKQGLELVVA